MKKKNTYGPEIKAQARELREAGHSYSAIARLLGVKDPKTVRYWLNPEVVTKCTQHNSKYRQENRDRILQQKAQYYQENRDSILQKNAQYHKQNPDHMAEYRAQYYQENRHSILQKKAEYYDQNRDLILRYQADYREQNRDKIHQQQAQYRQENKDRIAQQQASYHEQNRDQIAARRRKNRDRCREYEIQYAKNNPEKIRAKIAKYRATKISATPPWFTSQHRRQIDALYAEAIKLEEETGVQYHVDHIYPLTGKTRVNGKYIHTSCGLHVPWNLKVLTGQENCRKNCRMPDPATDPPTAW